ncbi:phthiocerol/phthiodiolone dimycocerosyl transferase family protein [Streptomyces xanthophaeus]
MTSQRLISPFESPYFLDLGAAALPLYDMPAYVESEVRGPMDPALVSRALGMLTARHPMLRSEVADGDTGLLLRVRDRAQPPLTVLDGAGDAFAELISSRPDWTESMLHAWLLSDGDHHRVVLGVHHGVADGRSAFALLAEFWRTYTALAAGARPTPERRDELPEAVDVRLAGTFPDREIGVLAENLAAAAEEQVHPPAGLVPEAADGPGRPPAARRFVVDRLEFGPEATEAFVTAARDRGATVNSMVTGLLLTAVRAQLSPATGPLAMVCGHGVDLRTRLTPELPLDTVLNCTTGLLTPVKVSHGDHPDLIGAEVADQFTCALGRRDPERYLLASLRAASRGAVLPVPAVSFDISNAGRIPGHPVPEGVRLLRSGGAANAPGMPPKIAVAGFGGRLLIQNEYDGWTYGAEQMGRLWETLRTSLAELAA